MRYDAVIFDLDGTLLDTLGDLHAGVNHALALNDFPERTLEEIRIFVGNGIRNLMGKAVPGSFENPLFEKVFEDFKSYYSAHCRDLTHPYRGIEELTGELHRRGLKLAIVSNKRDAEVKNLNEEFFGDQFVTALGEREGVARKPAPDSVLHVMELLGVSRERTLYVGDSEVDVRTAENAGVDCVAVTWGFRTREELLEAGAEVLIDSPLELLEKL